MCSVRYCCFCFCYVMFRVCVSVLFGMFDLVFQVLFSVFVIVFLNCLLLLACVPSSLSLSRFRICLVYVNRFSNGKVCECDL